MSNTSDLINLIRDIINPIGVRIYKFASPVGTIGTERIVLNSIPNTQVKAGSHVKINNDVVNINLLIPKLDDGQIDSARIEALDGSIQTAINAFNGTTTRVGYSNLDAQPSATLNENEKESLTNIRLEATYT